MSTAIVVRLFSGRVNINDIEIEWSFVSCSQVHIISYAITSAIDKIDKVRVRAMIFIRLDGAY